MQIVFNGTIMQARKTPYWSYNKGVKYKVYSKLESIINIINSLTA